MPGVTVTATPNDQARRPGVTVTATLNAQARAAWSDRLRLPGAGDRGVRQRQADHNHIKKTFISRWETFPRAAATTARSPFLNARGAGMPISALWSRACRGRDRTSIHARGRMALGFPLVACPGIAAEHFRVFSPVVLG